MYKYQAPVHVDGLFPHQKPRKLFTPNPIVQKIQELLQQTPFFLGPPSQLNT